jgi:ATP-binding cassette subfamily C protein CydCD
MKLNPRLLREAWQARSVILISITLGLIGGILGIFQAREISRVINKVFLQGNPLDSVLLIICVILLIVILRAAFVWGGEVCASAAARQIKQSLRHRLFAHIQDLGPAYLRSDDEAVGTQTGDLVNLVTEGIDALDAYFSQYLPQLVLAALIPLIILIFVFPADVISAVVLLVTAPLLPVFMSLIGNTAETLTRKQWLGLSRMSAYFLDVLQGLTALKSLGRSRDQTRVIGQVSEQYRRSTMRVLRITFLSALVLELVATLSTAVVAVEVGIRLLYGRLAFEQAFFILLLAPEFYLPLRTLGTRFHAGMAGVEAADRIYGILDLPVTEYQLIADNGMEPQSKTDTPPTISFKDVSFSYSKNLPGLDRISLEIPAGKMTALVGLSGAGKTTLTWLLLRFLRPQEGEITVDGKSLADIPVSQWRNMLAWVPQNPYLFNASIAANIRLTRPQASEEAVQQAARMAHADEFIHDLPMGYETAIGERGIRLSAGQAQRIALARAFLKDAPLLILDEATSHIDPATDQLLQTSIQDLTRHRTVLVIAHHQATLNRADQVIRLSHGRIDQNLEGKHITPITHDEPGNDHLHPIQQTSAETSPVHKAFQEENTKQSQKLSMQRRLLSLLSPFWTRIWLSIFLGFATVVSGIGLMATAAYIISAAALQPSIAELQVAIVGVRFFGISRGIFRYLERLVSHDVTFRLLARWRVWFYQALEPLAPSRLMRYHSGDLLARVVRDIGTLESFYVRTFAPPLVAMLVSVASLVFLVGFGGLLAWGLLGFLILAGIGVPALALISSYQLGPRIINLRARLSTLLVDGIQGMPELLSSGQADAQLEGVDQVGGHLVRQQARMSNLTSLQTSLSNLLANLAMLTVLVLAIQMISQGLLDGVFLGVVGLVALTCFEALQPLPLVAQNFEANQAAVRRLYELVDTPAPIIEPAKPLPLPAGYDLNIQNLSFQYPPWLDVSPQPENFTFGLKHVSFSLQQGKHIALIGPNGAGKTTLSNLLQRFWEYHHGSIRLGDHELREYSLQDIHNCIAVISQNTYLFSATIKENLLIANPQATTDEIIQATGQAQLYDFIQSLPAGYDTWIGEHGLRLSAGERQRLAIARALLKDSPVLILDEPTANLDPATELAVLEAIQELSKGRSTITITQRMVGLEEMDEILVLQNGCIVERGTHDQLLSCSGLYNQMWNLYHQIL